VTVHNRKLKLIELGVGANQFECQVKTWNMANNTEDGERFYTFCPDGEFREAAEPDYALELTFFSDWRSAGVSRYLTLNDQTDVAFTLDHHPDVPAEHVTWTGTVRLKAPSVGGDARTTEMTEVTLQVIGKPVFTPEVP
jgi:hypothetical protein